MKNNCGVRQASAALQQLTRLGDEYSMAKLFSETSGMADSELRLLESEIDFFESTGLIGVKMSRLLVLLVEAELDDVA